MTTSHPTGSAELCTARRTARHTARRTARRTAAAFSSLLAALAMLLLGTVVPPVHATADRAVADTDPANDRWHALMDGALARTALTPGVQAPAAWALIEPDPSGGPDPSDGPDPSGEADPTGKPDPTGEATTGLTTALTTTLGGSADTPFLLGSLSKPLTAAAVMRLVDAGELHLDAAVHEYLPGFRPQDDAPVTIAQLLTHTSGFGADAGLDARRDPTLSIAERAAAANGIARADSGGTAAFEYSNLNYAILGAVIESVSGEPFAAHLERELFAPLGMRSSSAEPDVAQAVAASGHRLAFGVPIPFEETAPVGAAPDGYTVSTAGDLAAFMRMLLRGGIADDGSRVLRAESVDAMLTEHSRAAATGAAAPGTSGYGLGWGTGSADDAGGAGDAGSAGDAGAIGGAGTAGGDAAGGAGRIAAHVGRTEGFFAHVLLRPADGRGVVVLQAANGRLYDQTSPVQLAAAAFDGADPAEVASEPALVTAAILAAFGAAALGAVLLVGGLRARRDRRGPAPAPRVAARRVTVRAVLDIGGAVLAVSLWSITAGMLLTGSPSWTAEPFAASIELTLIAWGIGVLLLTRGIAAVVRHRRLPRARPTQADPVTEAALRAVTAPPSPLFSSLDAR